MEEKKKQVKFHIVKILIPVVVFLAVGTGVIAKYVANNAKSGVAVASAIYFTANYAGTAKEDGTDDALENAVPVPYLGQSSGSGEYSDFYFEVRNHENMLLFNYRDIEIPYEVYFWLAEAPKEGQSYTVFYPDEQQSTVLSAKREDAVHFTGTLKGGAALSDKYRIKVVARDGEAIPIYVVAKSSYVSLSKVLKGKIQVVTKQEEADFIKSAGFVDKDGIITEELAKVSDMSELFYYVNTDSAAGVAGKKLQISWDSRYIEINRNNAFFLEWQENNPTENWKPGILTKEGVEWHYIRVMPVGYSSMKFGFFRLKDFSTGNAELSKLVQIELISD